MRGWTKEMGRLSSKKGAVSYWKNRWEKEGLEPFIVPSILADSKLQKRAYAFGYLFGVYFGDASICFSKNQTGYYLDLESIDRDFLEKFCSQYEVLFGETPFIRERNQTTTTGNPIYATRSSRKKLLRFMVQTSNQKTIIPSFIKRNRILMKGFLEGFIDSEGCISLVRASSNNSYKWQFQMSNTSSCILEIFEIMKEWGANPSKIYQRIPKNKNWNPTWNIYMPIKSFLKTGLEFGIKRKTDRIILFKEILKAFLKYRGYPERIIQSSFPLDAIKDLGYEEILKQSSFKVEKIKKKKDEGNFSPSSSR